ncbi:MAG: stage III sporulation AC/AD family protein [Defluviitaleaceae bacterium]|nr:stage III sporulation AC/AD family protein [Defluviitaleaceae bacterium]
MGIFQIIAVGILAAVLSITIKKQSPETALLIAIAASVLLLFMALPILTEAVHMVTHLGNLAAGQAAYVGLALRVVGVAYMAELGASVCTDAGETAIAAKIDLAGRTIILVLAMPVVMDILRTVTGLLP